MKILVTGAKGFVGKNLCLELKNIKDGKAKCYGDLAVDLVLFAFENGQNGDILVQKAPACTIQTSG